MRFLVTWVAAWLNSNEFPIKLSRHVAPYEQFKHPELPLSNTYESFHSS